MQGESTEWQENVDFPSVLNDAQNNFSVDVLIYFECLDEHTIGWFDFVGMCWLFLSNQDYSDKRFKWRYFKDETDKSYFKKDEETTGTTKDTD